MSRNKALMASALAGAGRPKIARAVREEHVKTTFVCHRPLLCDTDTIPVIHLR